MKMICKTAGNAPGVVRGTFEAAPLKEGEEEFPRVNGSVSLEIAHGQAHGFPEGSEFREGRVYGIDLWLLPPEKTAEETKAETEAEDRRIADEQRLVQDRRAAEEKRAADERRIAEDRRLADEKRIADEKSRAAGDKPDVIETSGGTPKPATTEGADAKKNATADTKTPAPTPGRK